MGLVMAGLGPAIHDNELAVRFCGEMLRLLAMESLAGAARGLEVGRGWR